MEREELLPKIREFVARIKELHNSNMSNQDLATMYNLYNSYFKRREVPGCQNCNANIWNALKDL